MDSLLEVFAYRYTALQFWGFIGVLELQKVSVAGRSIVTKTFILCQVVGWCDIAFVYKSPPEMDYSGCFDSSRKV